MLILRTVSLVVCFALLTLSIQINLHRTDSSCFHHTDRRALSHDCLSVAAWPVTEEPNPRQIIEYCLGECSVPNGLDQRVDDDQRRVSFAQLAEQQISSRELYRWSASIDLVERYQFYLNQPPSLIKSSMDTQLFYNCTWPRFGPLCEYVFDYQQSDESISSLSEFVHDFYIHHEYQPQTFTCYIHLPCNRGPSPSCLDWTEICDGQIHCLDGGEDEEHCWQLESSECQENEYRCTNGQCFSKVFHQDDDAFPDCLDRSDEKYVDSMKCLSNEPIFACEEVICKRFPINGKPLLSSSCVVERSGLLLETLFSVEPANMSAECWSALKCLSDRSYRYEEECEDYCMEGQCQSIVKSLCPDGFLFVPSAPILSGHLYLAYEKNSFNFNSDIIFGNYPPQYICSNRQFCGTPSGNFTCRRPEEVSVAFGDGIFTPWEEKYFQPVYDRFWTCDFLEEDCRAAHLYRCRNSTKCISRHRLLNGINDCVHGDDEQQDVVHAFGTGGVNKNFFYCSTKDVYISIYLVDNGFCDCPTDESYFCDDEFSMIRYYQSHVSFQLICDGFTEFLPMMIDGEMFSDESECEHWSCSNVYTRCDHYWNCPGRRDEIGCDPLAVTRCSSNEHFCVHPATNEIQCLSLEKINDGHIDCLGASDEVNQCRMRTDGAKHDRFYCADDTISPCLHAIKICDKTVDCLHGDDEHFCPVNNRTNYDSPPCYNIWTNNPILNEIERFFCRRFNPENKPAIVYFTIDEQFNETNSIFLPLPPLLVDHPEPFDRCHRGLPVKSGSDEREACFCPPNFYGDRCEYQNERVSLTVQFRALSDSYQTLFGLAVLLIDESDQRLVHDSQQFTYLPMRDCQMKFNLYLLYSTRPKNHSLNYSVQIDLYEKATLTYRSSWLHPLPFAFLPVQRVVVQLDIPHLNTEKDHLCSDLNCIQGRCLRYSNVPQSFCQCHPGWSGRLCQISLTSLCSADAVCLGEDIYHRSICLCPKDKFGPRCLVENDVCAKRNSSSICLNGGECLSNDKDVLEEQRWTCICRRGFTGNRCERKQGELVVTFDQKIELLPSILIHFIRAHRNRPLENTTTFKSIPFRDDPIRIYWSTPFDLMFLELFEENYYLVVRERPPLAAMEKEVTLADRCPPIREIFNQTIAGLHLLRRIKFYHLPCQPRGDSSPLLSCFFDEVHLCLCQTFDGKYLANCFEFDHRLKRDCLGKNACENEGQCFQDDSRCPQTSICICPACFYGTRCQFSMSGFSLSLDPILGDHIRPNISLRRQSLIIKITLIVTLVMTLIGWINGILALITFKNKKVREVGCGYYLLGSSLSTLITMTMFLVKFVLLISAQMGSVTNRSFLHVQCLSVDFVVRVGLSMDQWLNACVAIERAMTIIKGARFNKSHSRQKAKYAIPTLLIMVMLSAVYDPIYRRLIDDQSSEEEKRIWCIISSSSWLRTFDSVISMTHFLVPFGINLISAVVIIWKSARQRTTIRRTLDFNQTLGEQCRQHKHLLITPFLIIILGLPRIIISVASGCMQSNKKAWLFLLGYLISFICPMLVFVLFVLPSKLYRKEFNASMRQFRENVATRLATFRHLWAIQT